MMMNKFGDINQKTSRIIKGKISELKNELNEIKSTVSQNLQKLRLGVIKQPVDQVIEIFDTRIKNKFGNISQKTSQIVKGQFSELKNEFDEIKSTVSQNLQKLRLGVIQQPVDQVIEIFDTRFKKITDSVNVQLSLYPPPKGDEPY